MKLLGEGLAASSPRIGDKRSTTIALTKDGDEAVENLHELNSQAVAAAVARRARGANCRRWSPR